ncbi:hypothetical protein, partial [Staphylococcus felis]|uniref:hypothetical protein n=1 Tax=Staphylococcus felis TaxID=46127 RepID=UPI001EE84606
CAKSLSITRAIQKIVPQILKNCEVMPKTLHPKHRLPQGCCVYALSSSITRTIQKMVLSQAKSYLIP